MHFRSALASIFQALENWREGAILSDGLAKRYVKNPVAVEKTSFVFQTLEESSRNFPMFGTPPFGGSEKGDLKWPDDMQ